MTQEEIKELLKEKFNSISIDEEAIYLMTKQEGWKIMLSLFRERQLSLLEPINPQITADTSLQTVGAMALARSMALKELRDFVNLAETIRQMKDNNLAEKE